jgi:hypothetical protein
MPKGQFLTNRPYFFACLQVTTKSGLFGFRRTDFFIDKIDAKRT